MHCTARRMKRTCLLIGWIGAGGLFSAPMAVAQDVEVLIWLYALAHFPLLKEDSHLRHPTGPTEYRRLTDCVIDKWGDRCPENFDLVAIIENLGAVPVGPMTLHLTGDRKIGETSDFSSQPHPRELAQWEGPISLETRTVGGLDADSATSVWFGPFSTDALVGFLWDMDLWPWEAKYEVTLVCAGCSPMTASRAFDMAHPH